MTQKVVINAEQHVFADEFLDIVGNPFGSDHAKGLAEWIKNSADAYNRETDSKGKELYPDQLQHIYLRVSGSRPLVYECIDFVGMSKDDIDKAVKRWGDPKAASRGKKGDFLGGHGNGGKLYMRQMFKTSQFITYRDGRLNIFGFDSKGRYGFANGFENKKISAAAAIKDFDLSGVISQLPAEMQKQVRGKNAGFTIAQGIGPKNLKGARNTTGKIIERLCNHPQVRRPINRKRVFAIIGARDAFRLLSHRIIPKAGFEDPVIHQIPKKLQLGSDSVEMANSKFPTGELVLRTSERPFGGRGPGARERAALNCIEYLVGHSVVGVDRLTELGALRNHVETEFIYGECNCPILDDPKMRSVDNDRENLILNDRVLALRAWICDRINELTEKMADRTRREQNVRDLEESSKFNEFLNSWLKSKSLMSEIRATLFGGNEKGDGAFGIGEHESNLTKKSKEKAKKKSDKPPSAGSGDESQRGPSNPRVLLSNYDQDPLDVVNGATVDCAPRHPPVYQRDIDVDQGIFWINTQSPLAKLIRDNSKDGAESTRWREYMFQRHSDIVFKQALYEKEKKETELSAEQVDFILDEITGKLSKLAAEDADMQEFLFGKKF